MGAKFVGLLRVEIVVASELEANSLDMQWYYDQQIQSYVRLLRSRIKYCFLLLRRENMEGFPNIGSWKRLLPDTVHGSIVFDF